MTTTRMTALFDVVGDASAPYATPAWCRAMHSQNCALKQQVDDEVRRLKYSLISFRDDQHFLQLTDRNGDPFRTWQDFIQYPEPQGLGTYRRGFCSFPPAGSCM